MKTSILILDKSLARQSDTIAFFKVENDGFGLGAQRRAIGGSELPQVKAELNAYLNALRSQKPTDALQNTYGLIVPKESIAANGEYNLSVERYREGNAKIHIFPLVRIGDVCTVNPRKSQLNELNPETRVSFVPMADLNEHSIQFQPSEQKQLSEVTASYTYFEDNDVLLAKVTPCFENGKAGIARGLLNAIGFGSSEFYVLRCSGQVLPEWIYFCVMHPLFRNAAIAQMTGTGGLQRVPRDYVENFQIPLPPMEVQKEIVAEIEGYQKVINGARAVLDNYRPHIPIEPDWPTVELSEAAEFISGYAFKGADMTTAPVNSTYRRVVKIGNVGRDGQLDMTDAQFHTYSDELARYVLRVGDVVMAMTGATVGKVAVVKDAGFLLNQRVGVLRAKPSVLQNFVLHLLCSSAFYDFCQRTAGGGAQGNIAPREILAYPIPLPPLEAQQAIVDEIEAEQALVAANRELVTRFENKIEDTLARVWGGEEPTVAEA